MKLKKKEKCLCTRATGSALHGKYFLVDISWLKDIREWQCNDKVAIGCYPSVHRHYKSQFLTTVYS